MSAYQKQLAAYNREVERRTAAWHEQRRHDLRYDPPKALAVGLAVAVFSYLGFRVVWETTSGLLCFFLGLIAISFIGSGGVVAVVALAGFFGFPLFDTPFSLPPAPKPMLDGDASFADRDDLAALDALAAFPAGATNTLATTNGAAPSPSLPALKPTDVILGEFEGAVLRYGGEQSLITVGASGSGKQATIIGANLLHFDGGSVIVNDPKGESCATTARHRAKLGPVYVLNPFNVLPNLPHMKTARWNPLADLDPESPEFSATVGTLAAAIILSEGKEPHWANSARNLVAGVIGFVRCDFGVEGSLTQVNDIVALPDITGVMEQMAESPHPFIRQAAAPYLIDPAKRPRALEDVLNTARTQLQGFLAASGIRHVLSGSDFTWQDLRRANSTVYIVLPEAEAKSYFRLTRLIFASAIKALLTHQDGEKRLIYFLLDELATSLGDQQLDVVETAYNLGRAYGIRVHSFFQNWAQVESLFDKKAASIESGAGVLQLFRAADEVTYKKLQSRAGKTTVWSTNVSQNTSSSTGGSQQGNRGGSTTWNYGTSTNITEAHRNRSGVVLSWAS